MQSADSNIRPVAIDQETQSRTSVSHPFAAIESRHRCRRYGYTNMTYISSLISGVGIFCFGTGLSWYHGVLVLLHPQEMESIFWVWVSLD